MYIYRSQCLRACSHPVPINYDPALQHRRFKQNLANEEITLVQTTDRPRKHINLNPPSSPVLNLKSTP